MKTAQTLASGIIVLLAVGTGVLSCATVPESAPPEAVEDTREEDSFGGGPAFWDFEMIREETGHSYRPIYDTLNWTAARAEAQAQGGYLFVPNDAEEHAWVQEGTWTDVYHGEEVVFTAWAPEEPNNCDGCEHYAEMNLETGYWNDLPHDVLLPAIIEFDADPFETGLSAELGYRDQYYGVRIALSLGDGQHTAVLANGWSARRAVPMCIDNPVAYLYFQVDDQHYYDGEGPVEIRATYLDTGYDEIFLEYDSLDDEYQGIAFVVSREYSNKWKTKSVRIDDARFANRQNLMSDFRFSTPGDPLIISRVEVRFPE